MLGALVVIDLNFGILKITLFLPTLEDQKIIGPLDVILIKMLKIKNNQIKFQLQPKQMAAKGPNTKPRDGSSDIFEGN